MQTLITSMQTGFRDDDYDGWTTQLDFFAKNLADQAHRADLARKFTPQSQAQSHHGHHAAPQGGSTPQGAQPTTLGDPMDLDRISDQER